LYKNKTDTALLEAIFQHTKGSKEFFVQKAMGRMLREYSKTDCKRVGNYIKTTILPKLTIRE
jgi:3-methyladenine DNA glycosylase AlkD